MSNHHLTPRLATLAVESNPPRSAPVDHQSLTQTAGRQCPVPLLARPGRRKGVIVKAHHARAVTRWPVVTADPQREWSPLVGLLGGTPVRLTGTGRPIDALGGWS